MLTQACAVPVLSAAALVRHRTEENGRLMGVGHGFDNANDFAFLIALTLPFCLAFLLSTRNLLAKAAWTVGIVTMGGALVLTASRQGLITAAVALAICLWQFGWKGRRLNLLFASLLLALGILAAAGPGRMVRRLESTFGHTDPTAYLSAQIRGTLLEESVVTALKHPLLGIGPGNFTVISGFWRVAHNSFTEIAAEGGFPALVLFLMMLALALRNVRKAKLRWTGRTEDTLLAGALGASLVTFLVGGIFSSWEYQYLPYLMVAYSTVLYRIASAESAPELEFARLPRWKRASTRLQGQTNRRDLTP
jgi:O-antigen ligase